MIGKGNLHAHGGKLAAYLADDGRGEVIDKRGFLSDDLQEAFSSVQAIAESQTRCDKPFFHAYVRLPAGENLSQKQWLDVADRFECALGFEDQPRAVVMHTDPAGDRHMHVAWSRIDADEMRAIDPGLYKNKMVELCRELETEFGLTAVASERQPEQLTRAPARAEFDEARRLGVDVEEIRETIRACYDRSDNGPSFEAALDGHALVLARGDRRDFVVIDSEGGHHALGKRICGVTAADIRAKLGEDFKQSLPSVSEACALQEASALPWSPIELPVPETGEALLPAEQANLQQDQSGSTLSEPAANNTLGDTLARGGLKLFGAAAEALRRVAEAMLDFLAPPGPRTRAEVEAEIEAAQREAAAAPHNIPPPPGQMPTPEDNLDRDTRNVAIAKAQAAMEDTLRQNQDGRDRQQRDSRRDDDEDYGYERNRYIGDIGSD